MAANDDMSGLNTQERNQTANGAGQPTGVSHEVSMADNEHIESRDMAEQLDAKELSAITAPAMEYEELVVVSPSLPPNSAFEGMGNMSIVPQPNFDMGTNLHQHTATEYLDTNPASENPGPLQAPYSLEETGTASAHEHHQPDLGMDDGHQTDQTAQDQQDNGTGSDEESDEADEPVQTRQRRRVPDEDGEEETGDGEYSDDGSRDSEDEEADDDEEEDIAEEDIAELQSKLKRSVAQRVPNQKPNWDRRYELFEDDEDVQEVPRQEFNRNLQGQPRIKQEPGFHGYGGPPQAQQPPQHVLDPRNMAQYSGGVYSGHQPQSFMSASQPSMHQNHPMPSHGYQLPAHMPATPNVPHHLSPGFRFTGFTGPQGQHAMGFQNPHFQPYGQAPSQPGYNTLPMPPYENPGQGFMPPPPAQFQQAPRGVATVRNVQQRGPAKLQAPEEESSASDDDEPLLTRMIRHPSKISDAVDDSSTPAPKTTKRGKQQKQEFDSDVEEISSQVKAKPKMGFKAPKATKTAPASVAPKTSKPAQSAQPTQSAQVQPNDQAQDQASLLKIDWKLERYEAKFEPPATKDDPTVAKISLPNLVREELLLSPDHAQQEAHLLLHVFIPAHQALAQPDPLPATAALNFHTIALMAIEAFVQFEIGDEYGTGRGHWHDAHDQSDVDYLRQRSAKDADPDEIYFAVIDRWRAGMESGKESAKLIRGVQEFCDIALDVIYYIKENGLLKERKNAWEEKGSKKGAKKVEEEDSEEEGFGAVAKGKKRGATKVNEVTPRKKPKTSKKAEPKSQTPKKKKPKTPGVIVVRKK